jgi:hypothetical protein
MYPSSRCSPTDHLSVSYHHQHPVHLPHGCQPHSASSALAPSPQLPVSAPSLGSCSPCITSVHAAAWSRLGHRCKINMGRESIKQPQCLSLSPRCWPYNVYSIFGSVLLEGHMNSMDPPYSEPMKTRHQPRAYAVWSNIAFSSGVLLRTEFLSFLLFHALR